MKFKKINRIIIKNRNKFQFLVNILSHFFTVRSLFKIIKYKFSKAPSFDFNGIKLNYFYHSYRNHRLGERSIEIPIIRHYLKKTGIRDMLEIGNVINHYYSFFQDLIDSKIVVDKYEKGWGIINKDIRDYFIDNKYNLIISISTFEHMDSDRGKNPEYVKGKSKFGTNAADNIFHVCNNLLNNRGLFLLTAPLSQHIEWNQTIFETGILNKDLLNVKSIRKYYMKKINEIEWKQIDENEAIKAKYNYPLFGINAISIIEIKK